MSDFDRVGAICESMLTHATTALGESVPRTYVGWGEPAAPMPMESCDNEQLTAHMIRLRPKLLNDPQGVNTRAPMLSWIAELALVLWRCVPAGVDDQPEPTAEELDAAYRALTDQAETIARTYSRLYYSDSWDELAACNDVGFGACEPIAPSGGIAGVRMTLSVQL